MGAVWMRTRSELRTRWRGTLGLALAVGLASGPVIAAAAGARRTDAAYPRFLAAHRAADVEMDNLGFLDVGLPAAATMPGVAEIEPFHWAFLKVGEDFVPALAMSRDRTGRAIDRFKIVEGRAPNPDRAAEVILSLHGRDQGLRVGQTFPLATFNVEEFNPFFQAVSRHPMTMRVVGVAAKPGGFPPQVSEVSPWMYLTPAFYRLLPHVLPNFPEPWVARLKQGEADLRAFGAALAKSAQIEAPPETLLDYLGRKGANANVRRSFHLQALALWLLAALTGAAFVLIFGQLFARQVFLDSSEHNRLHALGMETRQLWGVSVLRAAATGGAGAVVAVLVALAVSPLTPTGLARIAEPTPGFAADPWAIGLGIAAVVLTSVVLTAAPAWRILAAVRRGREQGSEGLSRSAESLARAGAGAATVTGLRMAFERGRGANAVPVRTAVTGVTIGLAALVAALTFGASLQHLGDNERLYGVTWDMAIAQDQAAFATIGGRMLELPEVRGVAAAATGLGFLINDVLAGETFALDPVAGSTPPSFPLLEGSAPVPAAEPQITLGARLMKRLGVRIGDVVRVVSNELKAPTDMKVVGRAVLPGTSEAARSGEGAWVSRRGLLDHGFVSESEDAQLNRSNFAFLALEPGLSEARKRDLFGRIGKLYGFKLEDELYQPPFAKTSDLANFGRVERMPEVLAGILGMIATAALVHALVTAVQRRRRDLAVLKTLGFVRRQVRGAVAVQATALVAVALAVGIPIGVVAGRSTWNAFATDLGVIPEAAVPVGMVLIAVPAALLLANIVAALPARAAARTRPAVVLRSE